MKIRLHGTRGECEQAAQVMTSAFHVVSVSKPYPDRGASLLCRLYIEVRLPAPSPTTLVPANALPPAGSGRAPSPDERGERPHG